MRKLKLFFSALLMVLALVGGAYADTAYKFSVDDFVIDQNGNMGFEALTEVATTSDTITVSESGKTFIVNQTTGNVTFTLPTAASTELGTVYRFVAATGDSVSSGRNAFFLTPQSTDRFAGCLGVGPVSMATGDRLKSPNATGDSVVVVAGSTNVWYCVDRSGTFTDAN